MLHINTNTFLQMEGKSIRKKLEDLLYSAYNLLNVMSVNAVHVFMHSPMRGRGVHILHPHAPADQWYDWNRATRGRPWYSRSHQW